MHRNRPPGSICDRRTTHRQSGAGYRQEAAARNITVANIRRAGALALPNPLEVALAGKFLTTIYRTLRN